MPQMCPMSWFMVMFIFLLIYFFLLMMIYYLSYLGGVSSGVNQQFKKFYLIKWY